MVVSHPPVCSSTPLHVYKHRMTPQYAHLMYQILPTYNILILIQDIMQVQIMDVYTLDTLDILGINTTDTTLDTIMEITLELDKVKAHHQDMILLEVKAHTLDKVALLGVAAQDVDIFINPVNHAVVHR